MKPKLIKITTVPVSLYKLLRGQLAFMNRYFEVTGITSRGRYFEDITIQEGVPVLEVQMKRNIALLSDIKAVYKLIKIFKKENPHIVHTHTPKAGLLGMVAAKITHVPNRLHTVAGLPLVESKGLKRLILILAEQITSFCATKVYPNSIALMQLMINQKLCAKEKMKVIGNGSSNGIDVHYFNPPCVSSQQIYAIKSQYAISEDDFVYCFIGRIVKSKGINELIKAFDEISKTEQFVKLLLVGDEEPDLDPISKISKDIIKSNSKIISVGIQQDVRPFLKVSHLFVLPSYREGFPNVVLQASAMGLPSIVSDINGCNEIIRNDYNGVIIPAKNTEKLKNAMMKLYKERDLLNLMAQRARIVVVNNYEREYLWNCLLFEYQKCTNVDGVLV